ncbi:MAG: hypothetical protein IT459_06140 [Planctomycetes bacterium]|nr:hypothetical protein [Planctomycetota bacterium]
MPQPQLPSSRSTLWAVLVFAVYLAIGIGLLERTFVRGESLSGAGPFLRSGPFPREFREAAPIGVNCIQDAATQYEPWIRYGAAQLAEHGRLPLWKDSTYCGAPFFAIQQSALLWPVHWAVWWIGLGPTSEAWMALFHFLVGALGAYALLRHLGFGRGGSLIGGAAYGYCGFAIILVMHPHLHVSCLMPWLTLAADRCVLTPRPRLVVQVAVLAMLQHFAGHCETSFHAQVAIGVFALARAIDVTRGESWRTTALRLVPCAGGFVLGAGMSLVQLVPFIEYLRLSDTWAFRHQSGNSLIPDFTRWHWPALAGILVAVFAARRLGRESARPWLTATMLCAGLVLALRASQAADMPMDAAMLLVPDMQGPATGVRGSAVTYFTNHGFLGALLLLAVIGAIVGRPSRVLRFAIWTFIAIAAIGLRAPWFTDVIQRIPLLDVTVNERFTFVSSLAAAALCAAAIDRFGDCTRRDVARASAGTLAVLVALWLGRDDSPKPTVQFDEERIDAIAGAKRVESSMPFAKRAEHSSPVEPATTWDLAGWLAPPSPVTLVALQVGRDDVLLGKFVLVPREHRSLDPTLPTEPEIVVAARFEVPAWGQYPAHEPIRMLASLADGSLVSSGWYDQNGDETSAPSDSFFARRRPRGERGFEQLWLALAAAAFALIALVVPARVAPWCVAIVLALWYQPTRIFAEGYLPFVRAEDWYPETDGIRALRALNPDGRSIAMAPHATLPEQAATFGFLEPKGYDALTPARIETLMRAACDLPRRLTPMMFRPSHWDPDLRLLGVMAVGGILHPDPVPPRPRDRLGKTELFRHEHHFVLTKNDFAVPRAHLVAGIEIEPDDARAIERLRDPSFPLANRAILAEGKPRDDGLGDVGTARIVSTDPDHLVIDVDVEREAYLIVTDTDFPGWRARVDGLERRIERANVAFRAVALKRGDQRVEFTYEPKSVLLGGIGSAASALIALLLLVRRPRESIANTPTAG